MQRTLLWIKGNIFPSVSENNGHMQKYISTSSGRGRVHGVLLPDGVSWLKFDVIC